jgi:hypothetical protein
MTRISLLFLTLFALLFAVGCGGNDDGTVCQKVRYIPEEGPWEYRTVCHDRDTVDRWSRDGITEREFNEIFFAPTPVNSGKLTDTAPCS